MRITLILFCFTFILSSCASNSSKKWGESVGKNNGPGKFVRSFFGSLFAFRTIVPATASYIIYKKGVDRSLSSWATRSTPIFGSKSSASDWSDLLRHGTSVAYFSTALIANSGNETGPILWNKLKGLSVGFFAYYFTSLGRREL